MDVIFAEVPTVFVLHKRKLEETIAWVSLKKMRSSLVPWTSVVTNQLIRGSLELHPSQKIVKWINKNVFQKREFKQKQLYVHGPPNMGKTSMVHYLSKYCSINHVPPNEDYYDAWEDDLYDLAVIDEFRGGKTVQWMNVFLEGSPMPLRKKGSQYLKRQNIPVIVLSNFTLEEAYSNVSKFQPERLESIKARLEVIEVSEYIELRSEQDIVGDECTSDRTVEANEGAEGTDRETDRLSESCDLSRDLEDSEGGD